MPGQSRKYKMSGIKIFKNIAECGAFKSSIQEADFCELKTSEFSKASSRTATTEKPCFWEKEKKIKTAM